MALKEIEEQLLHPFYWELKAFIEEHQGKTITGINKIASKGARTLEHPEHIHCYFGWNESANCSIRFSSMLNINNNKLVFDKRGLKKLHPGQNIIFFSLESFQVCWVEVSYKMIFELETIAVKMLDELNNIEISNPFPVKNLLYYNTWGFKKECPKVFSSFFINRHIAGAGGKNKRAKNITINIKGADDHITHYTTIKECWERFGKKHIDCTNYKAFQKQISRKGRLWLKDYEGGRYAYLKEDENGIFTFNTTNKAQGKHISPMSCSSSLGIRSVSSLEDIRENKIENKEFDNKNDIYSSNEETLLSVTIKEEQNKDNKLIIYTTFNQWKEGTKRGEDCVWYTDTGIPLYSKPELEESINNNA